MKRLKYLMIHCTATPEGREVSSDELRRWHTGPVNKGGRGWKQVGYTDMIHTDGSVERLVWNNGDDWVDSCEITNGAVGYNGISRHVVYVGGLAADCVTPKDTRTAAQLAAMEKYVREFVARHPQVKVIGHNQVAAKACPSFSVPDWLKSLKMENYGTVQVDG